LTTEKRERDTTRMEEQGVMRDIPHDYGFSFPLKTMEEVDTFTRNLDVNNLKNEYDQPRSRRLELV
jgi:hypothetical protein